MFILRLHGKENGRSKIKVQIPSKLLVTLSATEIVCIARFTVFNVSYDQNGQTKSGQLLQPRKKNNNV